MPPEMIAMMTIMRKLPAIALDESARAVRRGVENRTLSRPARGQGGLETNPLRKFIAIGADDPEVTAWMSAHAQAREQNFFRWCRRF
jgi:hypothetical protein